MRTTTTKKRTKHGWYDASSQERRVIIFFIFFFQMALSSVRCWAPFRAATTFAVCQGDDEDVWTSLPPSLKHLQGSYSFPPLRCQTSSCAARVTGNTVHPVSAPEKSKESQKKRKKKKSQLRPVRKCLRLWSYFWIHQVSKLERKINKSWHTVSLALHSNQNFCLFWDVWCFSSHLSGFYQPFFFIYFF